MCTRLKLFAAFALLMLGGPFWMEVARADSWAPPRTRTYYSDNRSTRLIVTPHIQSDGELSPQRARGSSPDRARGVLQRRNSRGRWIDQWRGRLVNEVAPVDAVVGDSGRYFVTFDDWGDTGNGPNVIVIYDGAGRMIRSLSLIELVPQDYIEALVRTSFSIWWTGGGHRLSEDGERLLVNMGIPAAEQLLNPVDHFVLPVTLATGVPERGGPEWDRALAAAAAARIAQRERRAAQIAFLTQPILPPRSNDPEQWQNYLTEVQFRRSGIEAGVPMVILFRRPPSSDYVRWGGTPRQQLLSPTSMYIAIASPDGLPLAPALAQIVAGRRPGWLRGNQLLIVAEEAAWPALIRILGPSGATMIRIDPATPIPQRSDRRPDLTRGPASQN